MPGRMVTNSDHSPAFAFHQFCPESKAITMATKRYSVALNSSPFQATTTRLRRTTLQTRNPFSNPQDHFRDLPATVFARHHREHGSAPHPRHDEPSPSPRQRPHANGES